MESIAEYLVNLAAKNPIGLLVLGVLASMVVVATLVVGLTPSKSDDAALAKIKANKYLAPIFKAIEKFSLIKKS